MPNFNPVEFARSTEVFETILDQTAPMFRSYFESLVTAGFKEEQALLLTAQFHAIWWQLTLQFGSQHGKF